jgi:hypothetical protein
MHYPLLNTCLNWFKISKNPLIKGPYVPYKPPNKGLMIIMSLTCNAQEFSNCFFLLSLLEIIIILFSLGNGYL